jgi:hypothetical protein
MGARKHEQPSQKALYQRAYRARIDPENWSLQKLRMQLRGHGLTLEQYAALRVEQSDRCAACKEPLRFDEPHAVHIDHDHGCCATVTAPGKLSCGKCVRGLLCNPCNQGIVWMERYPQRVHQWMEYLRRVNR